MLIDSYDLGRIENNLLARRNQFIETSSWLGNILLLAFVLAGFGYFLYVSYEATAEEERVEKHIPFTPTPWLSATRNVRMEEYGRQLKPFEIETGYGLPGPAVGDSYVTIHGDNSTGVTLI